MSTAMVVGGGPNGLAAAVALAQDGVQVTVLEAADEIGGGARTSEAILPGLLHDHCSAFHPMAVGSPFLPASAWSVTACPGGGPRSTARTRWTAATPACCTARSPTPLSGLAPTRSRWLLAVRTAVGELRCAWPKTSWARCCGSHSTR